METLDVASPREASERSMGPGPSMGLFIKNGWGLDDIFIYLIYLIYLLYLICYVMRFGYDVFDDDDGWVGLGLDECSLCI